jgi:hypothetical protein
LAKKSELLEPAILMAYCAGNVDDPEVIEHVQSSESCQHWLSEHRLMRVLLKHVAHPKNDNSIARDKIRKFITEEDTMDGMLATEDLISGNPKLLEEFLDLRMHHLADMAEGPSKALEDNVLNQMLSGAAEYSSKEKQKTAILTDSTPKLGPSINEWISRVTQFLSPPRIALAGSLAAAALVAVIGGKQIGLYGAPDYRPIIVASIEQADVLLRFRGGRKQMNARATKKPQNNSGIKLNDVLITADAQLVKKIQILGDKPSQKNANQLIDYVNSSIFKLPKSVRDQMVYGKGFETENIDAIQIQPKLWAKLGGDVSGGMIENLRLRLRTIKVPDPEAPHALFPEKQKILNVFYIESSR